MGAGASSQVTTAAAKFSASTAKLNTRDTSILTPTQAVAMLNDIEAACQQSGTLFEDTSFPPEITSITGEKTSPSTLPGIQKILPQIVWKRPDEFTRDTPTLMKAGATFDDVQTGRMGSCNLHAGLCVLAASRPDAIEQLFVCGSDTSSFGAYGVRFFVNARWQTVIVDDRIPCDDKGPVFGCSTDTDELWVSIIEKAYAKMHGSYAKISGGSVESIWPELTGGLAEIFDLKEFKKGKKDDVLWSKLGDYFASQSFIACSADVSNREQNLKQGIHSAHAYGILEIADAMDNKLIRMRNPKGRFEWTGDWSDTSPLWTNDMKRAVGIDKVQNKDDGTFWMSLKNFREVFDELYQIRDDYSVLPAARIKGSWTMLEQTCGGPDTVEENPCFWLTFQDAADSAELAKSKKKKKPDGIEEGGVRTVIILTQEALFGSNSRSGGGKKARSTLAVGFDVVKVTDKASKGADLLDRLTDAAVEPVLSWKTMCGYRVSNQVHYECQLLPGVNYFIIPKTANAGAEQNFLLRVYSEKPVVLRDFDNVSAAEVRMSAMHPSCSTKSIYGTWDRDAMYACHPACERSDPPPERTFGAAPHYNLELAGKGKQQIWARLRNFQVIERQEVEDPLANKHAIADLLFQGNYQGCVMETPKEILINVRGNHEIITLSDTVTAATEGTTYITVEGKDDALVRGFAQVVRDHGVEQGERALMYVHRHTIVSGSSAAPKIKNKTVQMSGVGVGAAVKDGILYFTLDNFESGCVRLTVPNGVKAYVDTGSDFYVRLKGKIHPLEDDVKRLQKSGFIYPDADKMNTESVGPGQAPWSSAIGTGKMPTPGLPTLAKVLFDHRTLGIIPVEVKQANPYIGLYLESSDKKGKKTYYLDETKTNDISDVNVSTNASDDIWLKAKVPKGNYSIIPVSGAPGKGGGRTPEEKGSYSVTVFTNFQLKMIPEPVIDTSSLYAESANADSKTRGTTKKPPARGSQAF
ncbi:Calpain-type cysteine protease dek1 [Cymbomonas tetramitiformis]|uniref:Calpain-type cysteine protease dek1 n=1 Tax=Cymbomonas tetramitiformis TaxID=36881 RepID=A0AAE0H186_9CHLO|nr:Calpain-type cysteine protease dek1 [Cymbomonas tetramitiformis]